MNTTPATRSEETRRRLWEFVAEREIRVELTRAGMAWLMNDDSGGLREAAKSVGVDPELFSYVHWLCCSGEAKE